MNDTSNRAGNGMDDMKRLSEIYAATPRDEPPAAMDAAILAKAQAALVAAGTQVNDRGNSMQAGDADAKPAGAANDGYWRKPFAAAAMLVITASLVVLMNQEKPDIYTPEIAPAAPTALEPDLAARDGKGNEAAAKSASKVDFSVQRTPDDMPARSSAGAAATPQSAKVAKPVADSTATASPAMANETVTEVRLARQEVIPSESAREIQQQATIAEAGIPAVGVIVRGSSSPAGQVVGSRGSVVAGPPPPASTAEEGTRDLAMLSGPRARESMALSLAGGVQSPETMLARVWELRKNGQVKEATELLDELRKRYPNFMIPQELR